MDILLKYKTLESLKCIYDMWIFISLKKFFTEFFLEKLRCLASVFFTSKNFSIEDIEEIFSWFKDF